MDVKRPPVEMAQEEFTMIESPVGAVKITGKGFVLFNVMDEMFIVFVETLAPETSLTLVVFI